MTYYSRRHYRLLQGTPDAPGQVEERIKYRKASEQALAELRDRYPVLTAENFAEADAFRERRTQEILSADCQGGIRPWGSTRKRSRE